MSMVSLLADTMFFCANNNLGLFNSPIFCSVLAPAALAQGFLFCFKWAESPFETEQKTKTVQDFEKEAKKLAKKITKGLKKADEKSEKENGKVAEKSAVKSPVPEAKKSVAKAKVVTPKVTVAKTTATKNPADKTAPASKTKK